MLSVSVADRVRFKSKKGDIITALPVTVEFGKFVKGDRTSRLANLDEWNKLNLGGFDSDQVTSPTDLLHAVVALYDTCLPDLTAQVLYRIVCVEGARTLFLLRETSEILKEWENQIISSPSFRSREDSIGEINNNPDTAQDDRRIPDNNVTNTQYQNRSSTSTPKNHTGDDDRSNCAISPIQDDWKLWTSRNRKSEECAIERNVFQNRNNMISVPRSDSGKTDGNSHTESPFSDIFSDSVDTGSESDMEEDDYHDDFSRGLETFLRSVVTRRKESRIAQETYSLLPSHVGIEHKLIASATFHKNYKIPGVKVVNLSLLTVRKRYRKCGIGRYFLKKLKNPSQVGPYDALVVQAKNYSQNFFKKNDFTDDIILCSRFCDLEERRENTTILCYLPPFDGHYPPLPGVYDWDKPESLTAMQDEIEKWRQKSLESYQSHFTCLTRLQQEVLRLHNLLRRQETTITFLKKENYILQARLSRVERKSVHSLIETFEKDEEEFQRLCSLTLKTT
ncbi:uncharacterized protein LOC111623188 [Centruroides sculpturatus]|uniref:uncharacterized protein LOC111623188 n=1 Tax=Centruroides sculpturatus TaxID=218467 RepID=UPI000C6E617D|nr:uncharacterized protein LOC111623188 [Centruroides sculpturatus]